MKFPLCFSRFSRLKYPQYLNNSTLNTFVYSRVTDQHLSQVSVEMACNNVTRIVIPFKDQEFVKYAESQLKDLSLKL